MKKYANDPKMIETIKIKKDEQNQKSKQSNDNLELSDTSFHSEDEI